MFFTPILVFPRLNHENLENWYQQGLVGSFACLKSTAEKNLSTMVKNDGNLVFANLPEQKRNAA